MTQVTYMMWCDKCETISMRKTSAGRCRKCKSVLEATGTNETHKPQ